MSDPNTKPPVEPLSEDFDENYQRFIEEAIETGCVWGIESGEGWGLCPSLFRLNYHNQYYKAYQNQADLNYTQRLWLETLSNFPPEVLLRAAKSIIESSEFLPTLRGMISHCESHSETGLPDAHSAYIEACQAASPKAQVNWSHLAVYYAGKACDWFYLQSNSEHVAYPVFKKEYESVCQRVRSGEKLDPPVRKALPETIETPLSKQENLEHLQVLRDSLKL